MGMREMVWLTVLVAVTMPLRGQTVLERLTDSAPAVRAQAVKEAAMLPDQEQENAARGLMERVRSGEEAMRNRAAESLGNWKPRGGVALLAGLLRHPNRFVVLAALHVYGRYGTSAATVFDEVVALLEHPDSITRLVACRTLGEIGRGNRQVAAILARELERGDQYHAVTAASALAALGADAAPATAALGRALGHPYAILRGAAAAAVGKIGVPAAALAPVLIELWSDSDRGVRQQSMQAVEELGASALPALRVAMRASDAGTRSSAAWHVRKLGAQAGADLAVAHAVLQAVGADTAETNVVSEEQLAAAIPPTEEYHSPLKLAAKTGIPAPGGKKLIATLHTGDERPDQVRFFRLTAKGWILLRRLEGLSPGAGGFAAPKPFQQQGHFFVYVALHISGTGAMHEDTIFWIAPDLTLHEVKFTRAPEALGGTLASGEGVWKGESNTFDGDSMSFHFAIWKKTDGNCCPSAGEVVGSYRLQGRATFDPASKSWRHSFRIVPGAWRRTPIAP